MDKHMDNNNLRPAFFAGGGQEHVIESDLCEGTDRTEETAQKNRKWQRIRTGLMTAVAVMMIMSAAMGTAWAYFTTYATARGGVTISLGHEDKIKESFSEWTKNLTITSEGDSVPVYLRARGYCADYDLIYNGENWVDGGDGWWYYEGILYPRPANQLKAKAKDLTVPYGKADTLNVEIVKDKTADNPEHPDTGAMSGHKENDTFNVIVVYESTEVQYDENGKEVGAVNADWHRKVDTTRRSTTLGGDN